MSVNNFNDNFFFGTKKYRYLLEALYKRYSYDSRYVFIDKSRFSVLVQQRLKTDTVIQKDADESSGIEEKVVAWPINDAPHKRFFLETKSCTNPGYESDGWMKTCQADYLLYAYEIKDIGLDVYIINFPQLQRWFWENNRFRCYHAHTMRDKNRTEGRLVDIAHVTAALSPQRFLIYFDGTVEALEPYANIAILRCHILQQRIEQAKREEEEDDTQEEEEGDWREVQQRVEEILVQQEVEEIIKLAEEVKQASLWGDGVSIQKRTRGRRIKLYESPETGIEMARRRSYYNPRGTV